MFENGNFLLWIIFDSTIDFNTFLFANYISNENFKNILFHCHDMH